MKKWIGAGVLAAAAGAGLAWQQGWFGATPAGSARLTEFVPADTVLYLGGQADAKQIEHIRKMPLMAQSQMQMQELMRELGDGEHKSPQAHFAGFLLRDFMTHAATYGSTMDHYGLDWTKPQAIYMDGAMPVLRFGLKDEQKFWQILENASNESGLQPREITLEGNKVKLWTLSKPGDKSLELAINVRDGIVTLSAIHFLDTEADQLLRLALKAPEKSLAASGELEQLQKTYGFDSSMLAFVHFERLAQGFLNPASNSLGQDIKAFNEANGKPQPADELDAACRSDLTSLAAQVPRLVGGNTHVSKGTPLQITSLSVLELTNKELVDSLRNLRGHLPGHTKSQDQILGMGVGLDVDSLIPTATTLMQKISGYQTQCSQIKDLQRKMAGANPAMMGMFTGMVQGTKGIGFSLYDLELDLQTMQPSNLDFLVSVATENPNSLLGLLAMSPMGRQFQIPTDGSLTDIDLSFVMPGMSLKAGMQGQHLVAFSGDQATKAAAALQKESLDANGINHISGNYGRLADLIESIPSEIASEMDSGMSSGCVMQAQISNMLRLQGSNLSYTLDMSERGLSTEMDLTLDAKATKDINPVGSYTLMDQSYDCQGGEAIGTEEIRADGTGQYLYNDGQCDLHRTEYSWSQEGNLFTLTAKENVSRDDCESEWTTEDPVDSQCVLLPMETGFRCIYSDDESTSLFHYVPRG